MKITKAELRKIIEEELTKEAINPGGLTRSKIEINPGGLTRSEIEAQIRRAKAEVAAAEAEGNMSKADRARQDVAVYLDDLKGALPDPEEDSVDDQAETKEPNVRAAMEEIARVRKTMDWVDKLEASMERARNNPTELKADAKTAVEHLRKAMKALETAENTIDSLDSLRKSQGNIK